MKNNSGFIIADFLFSFVMVIGIGIFIFGFTFSLATIEVNQYIVWSTARNYAAGNIAEPNAKASAELKFKNLTAKFPLLTGNGSDAPWFELKALVLGDLSVKDSGFALPATDKTNEFRQPWTGASATLNLKLFSKMKIPFLGSVTPSGSDPSTTGFEFPIRAFIIRSPSTEECQQFFYQFKRWDKGIKLLENGNLGPTFSTMPIVGGQQGYGEDNGC